MKHNVPDKPYCNSRKFDRFMTFLPTRANINLDCCTEQDCLSARDHDTRCGTLCYTRKLPTSFLPWHMLTSIRSPTASRKSSRRGKANRTPTQRRSIQRSSRRSPPRRCQRKAGRLRSRLPRKQCEKRAATGQATISQTSAISCERSKSGGKQAQAGRLRKRFNLLIRASLHGKFSFREKRLWR